MNAPTQPTPGTPKVHSPPLGGKDDLTLLLPFEFPSYQAPQPPPPPTENKNRRDILGGSRGQGYQRKSRASRRSTARLRRGPSDPSLTSCAGLADFDLFLDQLDLDRQLRGFEPLKPGRTAVYPMTFQIRLLLDLFASGHGRVFELEALAADPLLRWLCNGALPSLDTVYRDLVRFGPEAPDPSTSLLDAVVSPAEESLTPVQRLEELAAAQGVALLGGREHKRVHLDVDPTVLPLSSFGIEGALKGYNPRYRGRPSYHPLLITVAETRSVVGVCLRPGNTSFGQKEIKPILRAIRRVRQQVGRDCLIVVRIDAAGDCAALLAALTLERVYYVIKADMDEKMFAAVSRCTAWRTTDTDAFNKPLEQIAELGFTRPAWWVDGKRPRVLALRSRERKQGKQLPLFDDIDMTFSVYLTNDPLSEAEDIVRQYDGRAEIEPRIAELKTDWGIGEVSSTNFAANAAVLALKILTYNLLLRLAQQKLRGAAKRWSSRWLRRVLIQVPGRLVCGSGRRTILRMAPQPALPKLE